MVRQDSLCAANGIIWGTVASAMAPEDREALAERLRRRWRGNWQEVASLWGRFSMAILGHFRYRFIGGTQLCKEISLQNLALDGTVPLF